MTTTIGNEKEIWRRAGIAMNRWKHPEYEDHLDGIVRVAKFDPEFAKQQIEVVISYVIERIIRPK